MKLQLGELKKYLAENCTFFLVEGRVEDAREKYPDMSDEDFDYLVANQPAGSNNKYLMWMVKQADALLKIDPDPQGLRLVAQAVRLFDGNKQRLEKKDLNQYKDTSEIEQAIEKLGGASKNQQAKKARADTDVIFNDDQFMVLRPHTTEASCKYGIGTKWCIAATASRNYFNTYSTSNNKFYFVIDKRAKPEQASSKFAIVILNAVNDENERSIQVFDATDTQVGLKTVIKHVGNKWPQIWAQIKDHVLANPITREVEDARKNVEELVQNLLAGKEVSKKGLEKIAETAEITTPIIHALIKRMSDNSQDDPFHSNEIIKLLSDRASELTPEGGLALIKFAFQKLKTTKSYHGTYYYETLLKQVSLDRTGFSELLNLDDPTTTEFLVRNPKCPLDLITAVANKMKDDPRSDDYRADVYRALIRRGAITVDQMRDAMSGRRGWGSVSYDVIYDENLSSKLTPELMRLVPLETEHDVKKFLSLPNVPPDLTAELISKYWNKFKKNERYELLRTVNLPVELIEKIWADKDQHVRVSLLQNPSIGAENAAKFADSNNSAYRFAVAHNPVTPVTKLQTLAGDQSASTRAAVASNDNVPTETLKVLANDEATVVRANVASNVKTPRNVLDTLKRDNDEFVRKSARKTLKSLGVVESYVKLIRSMKNLLLEELTDDSDAQDTMIPHWSEIPKNAITTTEFVAIFLLQNNGHATREAIANAFQSWNPQGERIQYVRNRYNRRRSLPRRVSARDVWQIIDREERYTNNTARSISPSGRGWWWSPAGIIKGSVYRLTPSGAAAALEALQEVRRKYPREWTRHEQPAVPKSPPKQVRQAPTNDQEPAPARGPKTTYKIYGRFKGHPAATRLKGQAYVAPANTQFKAGDQAAITTTDDGKLRVTKPDSDHTQTWEPIDG